MARVTEGDLGGQSGTSSGNQTEIIEANGQNVIALPDAEFVKNAEILRDGQDLVLEGPDGSVVVIEGYFSAEPAPLLQAPNGEALTPQLVESFVKTAGPLQYADAGSMSDESPVGAVNEVSGNATVTRTDGTTETITIGTPIFQGDVIETEGEGAVNLVFVDETSLAVSQNAKLAIDEYVFDPASESGTTDVSVLRGLFVFTSGLIGRDDPDDVNIDTPMGSIGIRGTIIVGNADTGEVTVMEGAIVMRGFDGSEITMANQFDTGRFDPSGGGVNYMGQTDPNSFASNFDPLKPVAPNLFSGLADGQDNAGQNDGPDGNNAQEDNTGEGESNAGDQTPGGNEPSPEEDTNPDDPANAGLTPTDNEQPSEGADSQPPADDGQQSLDGQQPTDGSEPPPPSNTGTFTDTTFGGTDSGFDGSAGTTGGTTTTNATTTTTTTTNTAPPPTGGGTTGTSGSTTSTSEPPPPPPGVITPPDPDPSADITSSSFDIDEDAVPTDNVGAVTTINMALAGLTFTETGGGTGTGLFDIDSAGNITVQASASFDFETTTSYTYEIQADDGVNVVTKLLTININDVNEVGVSAISDSNASADTISEDASVGTSVGITALASDTDGTDTVTYSLDNDAGGLFQIDANTGVVTLAGALDYETNTSHNITVRATSSDTSFSTQGYTINVSNVNDTPILTVTSPSLANISEDDPGAAPTTANEIGTLFGANISDPDGNPDGIAITAADNSNGQWEYYNGSVWVAITGVSDTNALLLSAGDEVRFVPNADWDGNATFDFKAWDGTSGTLYGTADTTTGNAFSANTDTANITVDPVNDAPVLDNSGTPSLTNVTEDDANPSGDTVGSMVVDGSITDADGTPVEYIAIVGADNTNGQWQYSTNGGSTWSNVTGISTTNAIVLDNTEMVRFVPNTDYTGNSGDLTYKAWDGTGGHTSGDTGIDTTGGATEFSTATETASLTVTAINDAPVLSLDTTGGPGYSTTYVEGNGTQTVMDIVNIGNVNVDDPDSTIVSITVDLTTFPDGVLEYLWISTGDESTANSTHNIDIAFANNGHTATLTDLGGATNADFEAVLQMIKYINDHDDPDTAARNIDVTLDDGTNTVTESTSFTVTPTNDDDTFSGSGTVEGDGGNDTITGSAGGDNIYGYGGDDTLSDNSDASGDSFYGGTGDDTFIAYYNDGSDSIDGGGHTSGDIYDASGFTTGQNVTVMLSATAGTANVNYNSYTDTLSGIEEIRTGGGDDTFILNTGSHNNSHTLDAGGNSATGDSISYANYSSANYITITFTGSAEIVTVQGGTSDSFSNFENITGTQGNDIFYAWDGDGSLTLDGDAGGFDEYDATGAGGATITFDLSVGQVQYGGGDTDMVSNIEIFRGNNSDNTFIGGAGNHNFIGGTGNDTFYGSVGTDEYQGDSGIDTLDFGSATNAVNVDLALGSNQIIDDGFGNTENVSGVEIIKGSGHDDIIDGDANANELVGGGGHDDIVGNGGDDFIFGDAGDDILDGGAGNDFLDGGIGDDHIIGGGGEDVVWAGDGNDLIELSRPTANYVYVDGGDNATNDFDTLDLQNFASGAKGVYVILGGAVNTGNHNTSLTNPTLTQTNVYTGLIKNYGGGTQVLGYMAGIDSVIGTSNDDIFDGQNYSGAYTLTLDGLAGDDTFRVDDDNFDIDGGTGNDTLSIYAANNYGLDENNLSGIETIDANTQGTVDTLDVDITNALLDSTDLQDLTIQVNGTDTLNLNFIDAGYTLQSGTEGPGNTIHYSDGTRDVFVQFGGAWAGTYNPTGEGSGGPVPLDLNNMQPEDGFIITDTIAQRFGDSISAGGDIDGDGYDDVLFVQSADGEPGDIFLLSGANKGALGNTTATAIDNTTPAGFTGTLADVSIAAIGDFDGDGDMDFVIADPNADSPGPTSTSGHAKIMDASGNVILQLAGLTNSDKVGSSVSAAGDVNGDGFADVLIGAEFFGGGTGSALLLFGGGTPTATLDVSVMSSAEGIIISGYNTGSATGKNVSSAGDIDSDGLADFAISIPDSDGAGAGTTGEVHIVLGSVIETELAGDGTVHLTGSGGSNDTIVINNIDVAAGDDIPLFFMGDIDGDGTGDFAITETNGNGAIRIFSSTTLNIAAGTVLDVASNADISILGDAIHQIIGGGATGDFNGDGINDGVIVFQDTGNPNDIDIFVLFGDTAHATSYGYSDLVGDPSLAYHMQFTIPAGADPANFDFEISSGGDIDGDGFDELVIGLPDHDGDTGTNSDGAGGTDDDSDGGAIVVYGRPGGMNDYVMDGIVSQWKMDEASGTTASDSISGSSNHGMMMGSMDASFDSIAGKIGNAMQFDGTDDYMALTNGTSGVSGAGEFTISSWIYLNSAGRMAILSEDGNTTNDLFFGINASNLLEYSVTGAESVTGSTDLSGMTGQWLHVAVTYDGANFELFLNGVSDGSSTGTNTFTTLSSAAIGARFDGTADFFNGAIDDLRVYNGAMPADGIMHLYKNPVDETMDQDPNLGIIEAGASYQILVGHDQNDTLYDGGAGYTDTTFRGGAGDDTILLTNGNFDSIDGGGGFLDTIQYNVGSGSLDFSSFNAEDIGRIEQIYMSNNSQTLTLTLDNIFNMLESSDNGVFRLDFLDTANSTLQIDDQDTGSQVGATTTQIEGILGSATASANVGYYDFDIGGYTLQISQALVDSGNVDIV